MIQILIIIMSIYHFSIFPQVSVQFKDDLFIGVVDRIEGDYAVILLEEAGKEVILERNRQTKEDKWLLLYWKNRDDKPLILQVLDNIGLERKEKTKSLLEKIRNK